MREYESVFVLHPKVDEAGIEREIEAVKQTVVAGQGEFIGAHKWGRKKLAYQIRKVSDGYYVITRFTAEPEVLTELDRKYKLNENVLRHLTVLAAGEPFPPDLRGRERRIPRGEGFGGRGGGRRRPPGRGGDSAAPSDGAAMASVADAPGTDAAPVSAEPTSSAPPPSEKPDE